MLKKYYINPNTDSNPGNNNEVHVETCHLLKVIRNVQYLGEFSNAIEATEYAKTHGYIYADGCMICSPEAHRE